MNRKFVFGAVLGIAIAAGATVGGEVASAASGGASAASSQTAAVAATAVDGDRLGTSHYLPLALARKAADTAMAACGAKGYPVSVTVLDRDGVVIDQERADTATGATVAVSEEKAYAAVGFQVTTEQLQQLATTRPGFTAIPGFVILPGGLPISGGGSIVAGIGVSGAPTGEIDRDCATVGINAIA